MKECLYQNNTDRMIVLKCIGPNEFYREKVVLPTETFWFEAPIDARLEIWQMSLQGQMLHLRADVSDYAIDSPKEALPSTGLNNSKTLPKVHHPAQSILKQ